MPVDMQYAALMVHSGRCESFVKETTSLAHCAHKTRLSAHFSENQRHSFPWGESDGRVFDCSHTIFLRRPTNIIHPQRYNNRRLMLNPCPPSSSLLPPKVQSWTHGAF
jgi:hypothetical protein